MNESLAVALTWLIWALVGYLVWPVAVAALLVLALLAYLLATPFVWLYERLFR